MDAQTTQRLITLNNDFYRANAASFSATRNHAWEGWSRLVGLLPHRPASALDVACGNMRFKRFLDEAYGAGAVNYLGIDSCRNLVPEDLLDCFSEVNLLEQASPAQKCPPNKYELVACFGFMHHVPGNSLRNNVLEGLASACAPEGTIAISFWQFAQDESMLRKAQESTLKGAEQLNLALDEGDYLLGWNGSYDTFRYCHSFSDDEIDALLEPLYGSFDVVARYSADGRTGDLNAYTVLRAPSR